MKVQYTKLLVARKSPKNGCNAEDGEILYVRALPIVALRDNFAHYFLSTSDGKTRSKYGWVAETQSFTLDSFVQEYLADVKLDEKDLMHLEVLFNSISGLNPGTPVAATYSSRGVEQRRMEFTVHRVFFYEQ